MRRSKADRELLVPYERCECRARVTNVRRLVVGLSMAALFVGAVGTFVTTDETRHDGCLRRCYGIVTPQYVARGHTVEAAHLRCDTDPDICGGVW